MLQPLFICCILVGVSALTAEEEQKRDLWSEECRKESGISQKMIEEIRNGQVENTPEAGKQVLCVGKKAGLIDESDDIIVDAVKAKLKEVVEDEGKVDEIVVACAMQKKTPEETVLEALKCLYANAPNFSHI